MRKLHLFYALADVRLRRWPINRLVCNDFELFLENEEQVPFHWSHLEAAPNICQDPLGLSGTWNSDNFGAQVSSDTLFKITRTNVMIFEGRSVMNFARRCPLILNLHIMFWDCGEVSEVASIGREFEHSAQGEVGAAVGSGSSDASDVAKF